jgi:hypothetical protein
VTTEISESTPITYRIIPRPTLPIKIISAPRLNVTDRVQYRFPHSKKRRVRKKWAARERNWRSVEPDAVFMRGDTLVCHPSVIQRMTQRVWRMIESRIFKLAET